MLLFFYGDFMNGLIIVNKEKNYTSRDIVNIISKKLNTSKIGHTGTLDPLATGVLVIAVGNGLKLIDELTCDTKEYIATVKLGLETDTLDVTGKIVKEQNEYDLTEEKLKEVLNSFLGKSIQEVPIYSAVKVNGKRLYEYARENKNVELPKREIEIFDIELLNFENERFSFKVTVSKGTYIRSLIRDIGIKLGVLTTMEELKRTKQGSFNISDSYSIEEIKNDKYELIPLIKSIKDYEIIEVNDYIKNKVLNGRILDNRYQSEKIAFVDSSNNLLALYKPYDKDNTKVKPIKVFPNE